MSENARTRKRTATPKTEQLPPNVTSLTNGKITIKLGQIAAEDGRGIPIFLSALQKLSRRPIGQNAGYWLGRIIGLVQTEHTAYKTAHVASVKKFGKLTDEKTDSWKVQDGTPEFKDFMAEMEELNGKLVELPITKKIKLPNSDSFDLEMQRFGSALASIANELEKKEEGEKKQVVPLLDAALQRLEAWQNAQMLPIEFFLLSDLIEIAEIAEH